MSHAFAQRRTRELPSRAVAQMAEPARDPALKPPWIRSVLEHLVVVIRLEHQNVERLAGVCDAAAHMADVVEEPGTSTGRTTRDDKPDRLIRVMWSCGGRNN